MEIRKHEFKKVFTSPVIITLIVLFIGFNFLIIFSNTHYKKELAVLNQLVHQFGFEINPKMVEEYNRYYSLRLQQLNEITLKKTGKSYERAAELFENGLQADIFTTKELEFFQEMIIIENYLNVMNGIDQAYEIDLKKTAETQITMFRMNGDAAETVRNQYELLAERFKELKENGEHKTLFFYGQIYKMHSFLYKTLIGGLIFQILILVVLTTGYIMNYEFENKTHLISHSSKRGRKLMLDKLLVAMGSSIIFTTVLVGSTLIVYFSTYSYSGLWDVPISSAFNKEYNFIYITWWNMSFRNYLICVVALLYVCQLLFTVVTFVISTFIRNSYIVFFVFLITLGAFTALPMLIPTDMNATFISRFTPFTMILNPFTWFMGTGAFTVFKYYEAGTVALWTLLLFSIGSYCIKLFKRQNIY